MAAGSGRGRPSDPIEVKRKRGTLRKDRQPAPLSVVPPADMTLIPNTLGGAGVAMWQFVEEYCGTWVAPSDMPTVRLLCEAMDRRADLIAVVDSEGILLVGKERNYINPAMKMLTELEAQITKWMAQLGLNPSDRGRLGLTEVKAQSKLEAMRERAEARRGAITARSG